jgi:hypothetical protein
MGCRSSRWPDLTEARGGNKASRTRSTPRQAAARATLAGVATVTPKNREGQVEMIRVLRVARRGAMKARVAAAEQLYGVVCSAPEELRQPLLGLKTKALVRACAALRPGPLTSTTAATKVTLRTLARRWQQLQAELDQLDLQLQELVTSAAPALLALPGAQGRRRAAGAGAGRPWIRLPALGVGGPSGADLPQKLVGAVLVQQGLQLLPGGQLEQVLGPAGAVAE